MFSTTFPLHMGDGRKTRIKIAATEQKRNRVLYSFARNVLAPFRINVLTSAILLLAEGCLDTHLKSQAAAPNARIEITTDAA